MCLRKGRKRIETINIKTATRQERLNKYQLLSWNHTRSFGLHIYSLFSSFGCTSPSTIFCHTDGVCFSSRIIYSNSSPFFLLPCGNQAGWLNKQDLLKEFHRWYSLLYIFFLFFFSPFYLKIVCDSTSAAVGSFSVVFK